MRKCVLTATAKHAQSYMHRHVHSVELCRNKTNLKPTFKGKILIGNDCYYHFIHQNQENDKIAWLTIFNLYLTSFVLSTVQGI